MDGIQDKAAPTVLPLHSEVDIITIITRQLLAVVNRQTACRDKKRGCKAMASGMSRHVGEKPTGEERAAGGRAMPVRVVVGEYDAIVRQAGDVAGVSLGGLVAVEARVIVTEVVL